MKWNACWYLGGVMDKLQNVFVAQQETLDQDLEAFRAAYFGNATAMGRAPSVECKKSAPTSHANISEASLRTLSVIQRTNLPNLTITITLILNRPEPEPEPEPEP